MNIFTAYHTDIGIEKAVNQDSICIKIADYDIGVLQTDIIKITMAVICDGMGGFKDGEKASASVIRAFDNWFENDLATYVTDINEVQWHLDRLIKTQNSNIGAYGLKNSIKLGTTVTALLL